MNKYVPIFRGLDARGGRKLRTDTHTNTRDNYSNPRCTHARRGLIGASLSEPHLVRTMISLSVYIYIIESVDSISRDERDVPLTQYITNA